MCSFASFFPAMPNHHMVDIDCLNFTHFELFKLKFCYISASYILRIKMLCVCHKRLNAPSDRALLSRCGKCHWQMACIGLLSSRCSISRAPRVSSDTPSTCGLTVRDRLFFCVVTRRWAVTHRQVSACQRKPF